jgi:hypothetical protein
MPPKAYGDQWCKQVDTAMDQKRIPSTLSAASKIIAEARSVVILMQQAKK